MLTLSSGNVYYTEKEYQSILNRNRLLIEDIETISNCLRDEAVERDWCRDYYEFVENVNRHLKVSELKTLDRDYEVDITVTRTQTARVTVSVTATDEKAAESYVNNLSFDEVLEQCEEGEYNIDWDDEFQEFEIEEVQTA